MVFNWQEIIQHLALWGCILYIVAVTNFVTYLHHNPTCYHLIKKHLGGMAVLSVECPRPTTTTYLIEKYKIFSSFLQVILFQQQKSMPHLFHIHMLQNFQQKVSIQFGKEQ